MNDTSRIVQIVEVLRCCACARIALAVDGTRITDHKCSGAWSAFGEVSLSEGVHVSLPQTARVAAAPEPRSPTWPFVLAFARRMEAKLEKNRHKGNRDGWLKDAPGSLLERLREETCEIAAALSQESFEAEDVADETADVANFAMMIADVCGGLELRALPLPEGEPAKAEEAKGDHAHEMLPCGTIGWSACRICGHTADCRGCRDCQPQATDHPWLSPDDAASLRVEVERLKTVIAYVQECEGGSKLLEEAKALGADRQDDLRLEVAALRAQLAQRTEEADAGARLVRDGYNEVKSLRAQLAQAQADAAAMREALHLAALAAHALHPGPSTQCEDAVCKHLAALAPPEPKPEAARRICPKCGHPLRVLGGICTPCFLPKPGESVASKAKSEGV